MGKLYDDYIAKPRVTETVTKKPLTVTEIKRALKVGRPKSANALSNAERQRMFRLRKKSNG